MASPYSRPVPPVPPYNETGCFDLTIKQMTCNRLFDNIREIWISGSYAPCDRISSENLLCAQIISGYIKPHQQQAAYDDWRRKYNVETLRPLPFELRTEPPSKEEWLPAGFTNCVYKFVDAMKQAEQIWGEERAAAGQAGAASSSTGPMESGHI